MKKNEKKVKNVKIVCGYPLGTPQKNPVYDGGPLKPVFMTPKTHFFKKIINFTFFYKNL